jgi:hypothetical protein
MWPLLADRLCSNHDDTSLWHMGPWGSGPAWVRSHWTPSGGNELFSRHGYDFRAGSTRLSALFAHISPTLLTILPLLCCRACRWSK